MKSTNVLQKRFYLCLFLLQFSHVGLRAAEVDPQLLQSLNSEAGHDLARKKEFKTDRKARKAFDNEREKDLALFLEQQEKWEITRERGLTEYRSLKKDKSPSDDGPEFKQDQKIKQQEELKKEQARILVVQTKRKITSRQSPEDALQELEELNIDQKRPRFDLRKRGKNKWVGSNGKPNSGSAAGGSSGNSGFAPPPAAFDDFPQPEFMPAPTDNFEDIPPPPPPPMNFDGSMGFGGVDSGFGDIPPPPPPPMEDDF